MQKILCGVALVVALVMLVLIPLATTPIMAQPSPPYTDLRDLPATTTPAAPVATDPAQTTLPTALATDPVTQPAPVNPTFKLASTGDLMVHLKNITAGYNEDTHSFD